MSTAYRHGCTTTDVTCSVVESAAVFGHFAIHRFSRNIP